ncbi:helix-turn-helix protein [Lacticaseibacillus paracasei]|nr:helix-turn-helix protein [Lacticaseibacillus paracasei]
MWHIIERFMRAKGYGIRQLSRVAGYKNPTTIYSIKTGQSKDPSFSTMIRIADALGVSLDELRPDKQAGGKSMTQVTVRLYKQGDKVWRDFKAELIKRYENSAMIDISESEAFSKIEKQEFNNRIVVSKKAIVEKRAVAGVDDSDILKTSVNTGLKKISKKRKEARAKYARGIAEAASQCDTLIDVAKRIGKSTTFVKRVASEFEINLPRRNNGHEEIASR